MEAPAPPPPAPLAQSPRGVRAPSAEKRRGAYYTPPALAGLLARWACARAPVTLLEPACGDGALLRAAAAAAPPTTRLLAFELDAEEAAKARTAWGPRPGRVEVGDFLAWAAAAVDAPPEIDAVVGNPPYVRYQLLSAEAQADAAGLLRASGQAFTHHMNLWVPFLIGALQRLRPGGRLGMVLPAELLHVLHAGPARAALRAACGRLLLIDPAELWFADALQGAVVLLAEKAEAEGRAAGALHLLAVQGEEALHADPEALFAAAAPVDLPPGPDKWTPALLTARERSLLADLAAHPALPALGAVARCQVGVVTGANHFFLIDAATAAARGLGPELLPMFGRSEHVPGVIFDEAQQAANLASGLPGLFLHLPAGAPPSAAARAYLDHGEAEGLHTRFKCRIRNPWWAVPSTAAAPVALPKRSHLHPRLVWNAAGARCTDTAYRIWPHAVDPRALVGGFVNSLTALQAELLGRHYGGGVLELVPSELVRLHVPVAPDQAARLAPLDAALRARAPAEALLSAQDDAVLAPLGVGPGEAAALRAAWARLSGRRRRVGGGA